MAATLRTGRKSQRSCEQKETIKSEPRKTSGETKCIKQLYIGRARFQIKSIQPSRRIVRQPAVAHNSKTKGGQGHNRNVYTCTVLEKEGGGEQDIFTTKQATLEMQKPNKTRTCSHFMQDAIAHLHSHSGRCE